MKDLNQLSVKEEVVLALLTLIFLGIAAFSIYGFTVDDLVLESRKDTYVFSGFNKYIFCGSLLLLSGVFVTMFCFGYLVKFGVLAKKPSGSLNGGVILVPMAVGIVGIIISALAA